MVMDLLGVNSWNASLTAVCWCRTRSSAVQPTTWPPVLGEHLNVQEFIPEQACDGFHKWVPAGEPAGM